MFNWIKTSGVDAAWLAKSTTSGSGNGFTTTTFQGFTIALTGSENYHPLHSILNWSCDVPLTCYSFDFVMPKGLTGVNGSIVLTGDSTTPAYTVEVRQFLVDLTACGIDGVSGT